MKKINSSKTGARVKKQRKSAESGDLTHTVVKTKGKIPKEPKGVDLIPTLHMRRRYFATSAVSGQFLQSDGHNQFLVAVTTILAYSYVQTWRIVSVTIWSPPPSVGGTGYCELQPSGSDTGVNNFNDLPVVVHDSTTSVDTPARVMMTTSPDTPVGSWHYTVTTGNNTSLFNIGCSSGSTVDIVFELVLNQNFGPSNWTQAIAGANVGELYARKFAGGNLNPQVQNVI